MMPSRCFRAVGVESLQPGSFDTEKLKSQKRVWVRLAPLLSSLLLQPVCRKSLASQGPAGAGYQILGESKLPGTMPSSPRP